MRSERTPTAKALCWAETDTDRRKLGEQMGLVTPLVLAVNDGHSAFGDGISVSGGLSKRGKWPAWELRAQA